MVGLVSTFLAFPLALFIELLFRNVRKWENKKYRTRMIQKKNEINKLKVLIFSISLLIMLLSILISLIMGKELLLNKVFSNLNLIV